MRAQQTRKIEQLGFVVIRLRNAQLGDADVGQLTEWDTRAAIPQALLKISISRPALLRI